MKDFLWTDLRSRLRKTFYTLTAIYGFICVTIAAIGNDMSVWWGFIGFTTPLAIELMFTHYRVKRKLAQFEVENPISREESREYLESLTLNMEDGRTVNLLEAVERERDKYLPK